MAEPEKGIAMSELELGSRITRCFARVNISTTIELFGHRDDHGGRVKVRGVGKRTLEKIEEALQRYEMTLALLKDPTVLGGWVCGDRAMYRERVGTITRLHHDGRVSIRFRDGKKPGAAVVHAMTAQRP